jgi:hypothetical protein
MGPFSAFQSQSNKPVFGRKLLSQMVREGIVGSSPIPGFLDQLAAIPFGLTTSQSPPNSSTSWQRMVPGESST